MPPKRKATSPVRPSPSKKPHTSTSPQPASDQTDPAERDGIVQRQFYPPEMSAERCAMYNNGELPRPIEVLESALSETKDARGRLGLGECVVHWFKRDLRVADNRALKRASEAGVPVLGLFVVSPQDYEAHNTAAVRVDFERRCLEVLRDDLDKLGIPLEVAVVDERKDVVDFVLGRAEAWGAGKVFCNMEYEVDELRREARLVRKGLERGVAVEVLHDDVVVPPGILKSGSGKAYSVYSPWLRAWVKYVHEHPEVLEDAGQPKMNDESAREKFKDIFEKDMPPAPDNKALSKEERTRFANLWPAGEHEAQDRLTRFLDDKIRNYKETRNVPSLNNTSLLSAHFATGTLAARTAIRSARAINTAKALDGGKPGIVTWISEIAWRDFYKHVLCHWPYICMAKPFKYEYSEIEWEYDDAAFQRWCDGQTGFPIVDAAMRQARYMGWMHNRCRMIVASFLAKDLLLDWRRGEKWFMLNLVDGDFASNNGGWGFSASCGVDPQPYFRIFNPLLQSEKFDPDGEFIRKWVPELADVKGKAVHDPYGRGAEKEAEKKGYPRPMVEHKKAREKALERYKGGLGRSTANVGGGVHN